jgi:hypothetical protein
MVLFSSAIRTHSKENPPFGVSYSTSSNKGHTYMKGSLLNANAIHRRKPICEPPMILTINAQTGAVRNRGEFPFDTVRRISVISLHLVVPCLVAMCTLVRQSAISFSITLKTSVNGGYSGNVQRTSTQLHGSAIKGLVQNAIHVKRTRNVSRSSYCTT